LAVLIVALPCRLGAQESPSFGLGALGIKGTAVFKNFTYFYPTETDRQQVVDEGILQLEWSRRLAPWSDVRIVGDIRGDDAGFTRGVTFQIQETAERRSILNLKEAVLRVRGGPVEATFGRQIFAWGTADSFNPTDNINPYDYLDLIDNEKMGVYSAAARLTLGATSLVAIVVPVFTPSRLPLPGSRWIPQPPPDFVAVVDGREVPPPTASNMQYAARLRTTLRGVDLSLSYYDGFENTPVVRQSSIVIAPSTTVPRFTPVFTRIRVVGLDFSTTYGKFELHGEGAFRFAQSNGREDRFQWITGLNYTWDELPTRRIEQIVFILEYAREETLASRNPNILEPGTPPLTALGPKSAFRHAVAGRILVKFTEDTQLRIGGALDLIGGTSYYLQTKVSHKLSDALHLEGGLDLFGGPDQTFWGARRNNDRVFALVKYFF
jgi:hypothetical protein